MNAYCRPEYPDQSDMEEAASFIAMAIDTRIPYTKAIIAIANRIHEIRESSSAVPPGNGGKPSRLLADCPPASPASTGRES